MITLAQFRKLFPSCAAPRAALLMPLLVAAMREFGIVTRKRAAAFVAQVGHESNDLRWFKELASGDEYDTRTDLGNTPQRDGDGRKYKGRGPIQTTGRTNYAKAAKALSLPLLEQPELLEQPANGFRASAFFWQSNKLNQKADALNGRDDYRDLVLFDKISRVVNGGNNGRLERERRYIVALSVLTDSQFEEASVSHTLDVLTTPTAAAVAPQTTPSPEVSAQGQQTPAAATPKAAPEESLIDEIPVTEETKAAGVSVLRKLGLRAGVAVGTLWGGGVAGKLLVALAVVIVVGLVVYYRRDVRELAVRLLHKLKGAQ